MKKKCQDRHLVKGAASMTVQNQLRLTDILHKLEISVVKWYRLSRASFRELQIYPASAA